MNFISLTDLAKYSDPEKPSDVIVHWLSNKSIFNYLRRPVVEKVLHLCRVCVIINGERDRLERRPLWILALVGIEPVSPYLQFST